MLRIDSCVADPHENCKYSVSKGETNIFHDYNVVHNLETQLMEGRGSAHMHDTRFPFVVPIVAFLSGFREDAVVVR